MTMRKKSILIQVCCISTALFCTAGMAAASWELYDDFSGGTIDPAKWSPSDKSATITVENGMAKFVHNAGFPRESARLSILDSPETIGGIKATVLFESCSNDNEVRARIDGFIGNLDNNFVYANVEMRPYQEMIRAEGALLGPAPDYTYNGAMFYGENNDPENKNLIGTPVTISYISNQKFFDVDIEGQSGITFTFHQALSEVTPVEENFTGIGTRSNSGKGTCTVYFDDVYIMRNSSFSWSSMVPIISKEPN